MQQRWQMEWISPTLCVSLWNNCTSQTKRGPRQNATSQAEAPEKAPAIPHMNQGEGTCSALELEER